ncbi:MAG: hypothetical protein GYA24_10095 [Candidatus Lokiarchaeota archaeon]|nr:hypothetical protein [Candidatus Lokiarchaeota archaeon]
MDITIRVDKPEAHPGNTLHCKVQIQVKSKTKTRRIVAAFFGEFFSVYSTGKHTYTNRNVFVKLEKPLWIPEDGKAGNIEPGTHEYTADFIVPDGLMPSFPPASMEGMRFPGRLQYFVKAVATKVIGFEDERFEKIYLVSRDFASTTAERRRFGTVPAGKTRPMASLTLDRSTYKPGGMIQCKVVVDKQAASCKIQDAVLSIRNKCWGWVENAWHVEDVWRDEYSLGMVDSSSKDFTLAIPIDACPTLYGGNVKVTWDVHLDVKLALAMDAHLTVPVVVISSGASLPVEDMGTDVEPGVRFCRSCGTVLESGSNKCAFCGDVLDEP